MSKLNEMWDILSVDEDKAVWDKFNELFSFHPSALEDIPAFKFNQLYDEYDISRSPLYSDDERANAIMKNIFAECLGEDDYMYVLDYQHTSFRYNPQCEADKKSPMYLKDDTNKNGGYYVYFPEFYPNGDYYFFNAKDFSWGYFTHPWQKKSWVFGEAIMWRVHDKAAKLGFMAIV